MKKVLIPIAPGFEMIEVATVLEVLSRVRAGVTLAAETLQPVAARNLQLVPDITFDQVDPAAFDMLVIVGGEGARALRDEPRIREIAVEMATRGALLAAICRGPIVLAAAGVLDGRRVTASPSSRDELGGAIYVDERVVVDGRIITSRLPGTALEFALELVRQLYSDKHADYVAAAIEASR